MIIGAKSLQFAWIYERVTWCPNSSPQVRYPTEILMRLYGYTDSTPYKPASIMDDERPLMIPNVVVTKQVRWPCSRVGRINCATMLQPKDPRAKSKQARPATNRLVGVWRNWNRATAVITKVLPPMMNKDTIVYRATGTQGMAYGRASVLSAMESGVVIFGVNAVMFQYADENVALVDIPLFATSCKIDIDKAFTVHTWKYFWPLVSAILEYSGIAMPIHGLKMSWWHNNHGTGYER